MFFVQKETQIRQQNDALFDVPYSREQKAWFDKENIDLIGISTMYAGNLNLMDTWSVVITCDHLRGRFSCQSMVTYPLETIKLKIKKKSAGTFH